MFNISGDCEISFSEKYTKSSLKRCHTMLNDVTFKPGLQTAWAVSLGRAAPSWPRCSCTSLEGASVLAWRGMLAADPQTTRAILNRKHKVFLRFLC